jgi:hypothetical protein
MVVYVLLRKYTQHIKQIIIKKTNILIVGTRGGFQGLHGVKA